MSPQKARLYFAEYRKGTLDSRITEQIRSLLKSDPELKAEYEMDGRLEAIIALKRYEQPEAGSLDTFVAEFHRRQRSEQTRTDSILVRFREKLEDYILSPTASLVRTAAGAAALALVLGLSLFHYSPNHGARSESAWVAPIGAADPAAVNASVVLANNDVEAASYVLPRINGDAGPNAQATSQHGAARFEF
jgi:hypothetical protein